MSGQHTVALERALSAAVLAVPGVAAVTAPTPLARLVERIEGQDAATVRVDEGGATVAIAIQAGYQAAAVTAAVHAALRRAWAQRAPIAGSRPDIGRTRVRIVSVVEAQRGA